MLPAEQYFRFNPTTGCGGIDEVRPEKLVEMVEEARTYIEANSARFQRLAEILKPRGPLDGFNKLWYLAGTEVRHVEQLFRKRPSR